MAGQSRGVLYLFMVVVATLEALSQTFFALYGDKDLAAVGYVMAGLCVGILPLVFYSAVDSGGAASRLGGRPTNVSVLGRRIVWILLSAILVAAGSSILQSQALDYKMADMLPILQIMGERWLQGADVYAVIPEIWDGMRPIYLPLLWLSYVPALLLGLDIRWVNVAAILVVAALVLDVFDRRPWPLARWLVLLPLSVLLAYVFGVYSTFISLSEEPIVLLAYTLLGYAIWKDKPWLVALALVYCMLSRYAMVFWMVAWWLYLYWQEGRAKAWQVGLVAAVVALLVLWVSQGIYQLGFFYGLKDTYVDNFLPEKEWGTSSTIQNNIGLARFVPFAYLPLMHRLLFWGSLLLPVALFALYHVRLRRRIPFVLFSLCSLKICMVYFYNMNPFPYSYLFYTSTFFSIVVLWGLFYLNPKIDGAVARQAAE